MNVREWSTGHRHTTPRNTKVKRPRQHHVPPLKPSRTGKALASRAAETNPNLLLDPIIGPLMMAQPDIAEYLISRSPSHALAQLGSGSPYKISKRQSGRHRSSNPRQRKRQRSKSSSVSQTASTTRSSTRKTTRTKTSSKKVLSPGIDRLKQLHGGGNGRVTLEHTELDSNQAHANGGAEFRVVQAILKREHLIREMQRIVSTSNTRPYFATDAVYMLLDLRAMSVDCIEGIAEWRRPHSKIFDFMWEGENYLLKMYRDTSFLRVCRPLGLCMSLPGIANNPLLDFDEAAVERAEKEYNSSWAGLCRRETQQTLDYDPAALVAEKQQEKNARSMRSLKPPVMLVHAQHIVKDEFRRLGLTHDCVNGKLVKTEVWLQLNEDKKEEKRRHRMTLKRLEFELFKKRQTVRDRKGFESLEEERKTMTEEEWKKKRVREKKEESDLKLKHPEKEDTESYTFRRTLLLKPNDREFFFPLLFFFFPLYFFSFFFFRFLLYLFLSFRC